MSELSGFVTQINVGKTLTTSNVEEGSRISLHDQFLSSVIQFFDSLTESQLQTIRNSPVLSQEQRNRFVYLARELLEMKKIG